MKSYEEQYFDGLHKILNEGTVCVSGRQSGSDNVVRTKRTWGVQFTIDLEEEFPLLESKHVAVKSAIREILWIMRKQSNNVKDLRPHIWDKWADEDGSIGKSYGYQVGHVTKHNGWIYHDQVDYVLRLLEKDPSSRHGVIDLWRCDELNEMNLVPCCYTSHFAILDGRLNCMLTQRSGDYLIGVPFNTAQYAFLSIAFARHLGVKPGILIHNISDAHIYESQYGDFDTSSRSNGFSTFMNNHAMIKDVHQVEDPIIKQICNSKPELIFKTDDTNFWNIGDDDFDIKNYEIGVDCFKDITFAVEK